MSFPHRFADVGRCIYCCNTDGLSDEHIIPQSLGWKLILPKASCLRCAVVTARFEQVVARDMYWPLRMRLGMRGKRRGKGKKLTHAEITISDQDATITEQIKGEALPLLYACVELPLPGFLTGGEPSGRSPEMKILLKGSAKEMEAFARERGAGKMETSHVFHWSAFCRMIAKIAHSFSVAHFGLDGLHYLLPPLILGQGDHLAYLTGGQSAADPPIPEGNDLMARVINIRGIECLTVSMNFFGGRTPTYEAVAAFVRDPRPIRARMR